MLSEEDEQDDRAACYGCAGCCGVNYPNRIDRGDCGVECYHDDGGCFRVLLCSDGRSGWVVAGVEPSVRALGSKKRLFQADGKGVGLQLQDIEVKSSLESLIDSAF